MTLSPQFRRSILTSYSLGLRLYPADFHKRHADEMLHCASDLLSESASGYRTVLLLADDLFRSLLMENFVMTIPRLPQLAILPDLDDFPGWRRCPHFPSSVANVGKRSANPTR